MSSNSTPILIRTTLPARALTWMACIVVSLGLVFSTALVAKESLPEVSPEGLELQKDTKARAVYLKPGVTFDKYQRIKLLDCYVEFAKDWQRDYNRDVVGLDGRVSDSDVEKVKTALAAEFRKIFTEELQKNGGYEIVDTDGADVLVLRPALVNLMVTAPDLMTAGMRRVVVDSAGQMTLYLEFWDSASNTILARVMDPQADHGFGGRGQIANRASNQRAADIILRDWANRLRTHLDAVRAR